PCGGRSAIAHALALLRLAGADRPAGGNDDRAADDAGTGTVDRCAGRRGWAGAALQSTDGLSRGAYRRRLRFAAAGSWKRGSRAAALQRREYSLARAACRAWPDAASGRVESATVAGHGARGGRGMDCGVSHRLRL